MGKTLPLVTALTHRSPEYYVFVFDHNTILWVAEFQLLHFKIGVDDSREAGTCTIIDAQHTGTWGSLWISRTGKKGIKPNAAMLLSAGHATQFAQGGVSIAFVFQAIHVHG